MGRRNICSFTGYYFFIIQAIPNTGWFQDVIVSLRKRCDRRISTLPRPHQGIVVVKNISFNLKTAVKENENGADTRKHLRILKFLARNPGTVRVSTKNSKAKVISRRCAIFRPATAVFRIIVIRSISILQGHLEQNAKD